MIDKVEVLLSEYTAAMESFTENTRDYYARMGFEELDSADSKAHQILAVRNILE
jgi:hypothetical protein